MAYTPPLSTEIVFDFGVATTPYSTPVLFPEFEFGGVPETFNPLGYVGEESSSSLVVGSLFSPLGYVGEGGTSELLIAPAATFDPLGYVGEESSVNLQVGAFISTLSYVGEESSSLLSISAFFDPNAYVGEENSATLYVAPPAQFAPLGYVGEESSAILLAGAQFYHLDMSAKKPAFCWLFRRLRPSRRLVMSVKSLQLILLLALSSLVFRGLEKQQTLFYGFSQQ